MSSRRKFLQQLGTVTGSAILLPQLGRAASIFPNKSAAPIGLQLYTLGDLMTTDTKGTLAKVAAIGYTQMESAGSPKGNWYGFTPKELSAMIKDAGMH
ncbi:MAG TPA: hypothetical protein VNV35_01960, partial [Puia sp.]|nr:hypothetical protein [Puia sp.]